LTLLGREGLHIVLLDLLHHGHGPHAQKSKRAATPSGVVGALAILSAFCLLTEEMLTPVTML
jgi:hypothetical protein